MDIWKFIYRLSTKTKSDVLLQGIVLLVVVGNLIALGLIALMIYEMDNSGNWE